MYKAIFYTHLVTVNLFLLLYVVKAILLLANNDNGLAKLTKATRVPEMLISTLFLITGIYMLTQVPEIKSLLIIKILLVLASIPVAVIGFKRKKKVLAVLSVVLLIAAYGLAEMSKKQKSETPVVTNQQQGISDDGQLVYAGNCAKCHGDDGKAGVMGASDLSATTLDANAKLEIVKNGKGAMPAFAGQLSDEQIGEVVGYIETLKK